MPIEVSCYNVYYEWMCYSCKKLNQTKNPVLNLAQYKHSSDEYRWFSDCCEQCYKEHYVTAPE